MQTINPHGMSREILYPKLFLHEEIAKHLLESDGLYPCIQVNDFSEVYDKVELCAFVDLNRLDVGFLSRHLEDIMSDTCHECHTYLEHLYRKYHVNDPIHEVYIDYQLLKSLLVGFLDSRSVLINGEKITDVYYERDNPNQLTLFT